MKRIFLSLFSLTMALLLVVALAYPAYAEGSAPVAENLELRTYRGVAVGARLRAFDPEDDVTGYEICTQPVKGRIELEPDGSFVYEPKEGKKGRDYFGYRAKDSQGNLSQEATVTIKIEKQRGEVSYSDMEGSPQEFAAVHLAEEGIFTGEKIGDSYCFGPEKELSRGEFLSMCMLASDGPLVTTVMNTGFEDDDRIPCWMKPYVASAAMSGADCLGQSASFGAAESISKAQAALILDELLKINDVSYMELDMALEEDMAQACADLEAAGIVEDRPKAQETLTRSDAAQLLSRALELISGR